MPRGFRSLVLCYHALSDEWNDALAVSHADFRGHIKSLLSRGFTPVSAADVLGGAPRRFHITFDDAYRSISGALPVLHRLGVPATVFACTSYAGSGGVFDVPEVAVESVAHADHLKTLAWDELRDLAAHGVEIGSHTVRHPHLPELSDAELRGELLGSRIQIEDEIGRPCPYLAYPYGEHDARVRATARTAGYRAAFALKVRRPAIDAFAVPRVDLHRKDGRLRARLKTGFVRELADALAYRPDSRAVPPL